MQASAPSRSKGDSVFLRSMPKTSKLKIGSVLGVLKALWDVPHP